MIIEFKNIQELEDIQLYIKKNALKEENLKEKLLESISFYYEVTNFEKFKEKYNLNLKIDISENILKFNIDEHTKQKLKIPFLVAEYHTNENGIYNQVKILCEIDCNYIYKNPLVFKKNKYHYDKIIYI